MTFETILRGFGLAPHTRLGWDAARTIRGLACPVICVPLHHVCLSPAHESPDAPKSETGATWPELAGEGRKRAMLCTVISFIVSGYIMEAIMTLWAATVQDPGRSVAIAAVAGAVIGPFKTIG